MATRLTIPGMVDPHVHLRGMDWAHKATFASETAAALAGGYWAVLDMPNTPPNTTTPDALQTKLAAIDAEACCDWGIYYGASQDDNSASYAAARGGVCGLKIYNNATTGTLLIDDQALRERVYAAWPGDRVIAVHAEGETVLDILTLVGRFRKHTHFCHISTAEELGYLRAAKAEGLPISIGVTPHHLMLTEEDVPRLGGFGRMKPELKTRADAAALWEAVADGLVDVIESDHAPHTLQEKTAAQPAFGVPGLETTLPILGLAVHEGRLTEAQLVDLLALNAQRIFGLTPPEGTYTVVDLDDSFVITPVNLFTQCGWSPFAGLRVYGRVREVWIRGRQVFDGSRVLVEPGFGQNQFGG
ncbi:MAG: amidohydrolase family protein [Anaerolineae bacterium]|nr:amidohydrolase family protein [Anaerolineae bacterium]